MKPVLTSPSGAGLRALEPTDADFLYEAENDAAAWQHGDTLAPLSRRVLREYALNADPDPFRSGQVRLVAVTPDGTPFGIADLYEISPVGRTAFTAVYVLPGFRRRGLGLEMLRLLMQYAADVLLLRSLASRVASDNAPSIRLFSTAGFKHAGQLPRWIARKNGTFADQLLFTLPLTDD